MNGRILPLIAAVVDIISVCRLLAAVAIVTCITGCQPSVETPGQEEPAPGPTAGHGTTHGEPGSDAAENKPPEDPALSAADVYKLFSENTPEGDRLYKNKMIRVRGLVEDPFLVRVLDIPSVMIGQSDRARGVTRDIQCLMHQEDDHSLGTLWRGQEIIIEGTCRGYQRANLLDDSDNTRDIVLLDNCRIVKTGPAIETITTGAGPMLAELADNEPAFMKRYGETVLRIDGVVAAIDTERRQVLIKGREPLPSGRPHYLRIDFLKRENEKIGRLLPGTPIRVKGQCGEMDANGNIPLYHGVILATGSL